MGLTGLKHNVVVMRIVAARQGYRRVSAWFAQPQQQLSLVLRGTTERKDATQGRCGANVGRGMLYGIVALAEDVLILLSLVQTEREPCVRQLLDDTFI